MNWRPRWNLRLFLCFMLIAGCVAGLWGRRELQKRREAEAVKTLAASGVVFRYGPENAPTLSNSPGAKHNGPATGAYLNGQDIWLANIDLAPLRELRHLKTLSFSGSTVPNDSFRHLAKLPNLEELDLSFFPVDDAMLEIVGKISSLRKLHIQDSQMTIDGLQQLVKLGKLTTLDIRMNRAAQAMEGTGKILGQITTLQDLSVTGNFTEVDLAELNRLKNLKFLNLRVPQLNTQHLEGFTACPQLQRLSIYSKTCGNESLEAIGKLTGLELFRCALPKTIDHGMHHLKSLKKLKIVDLVHSAATERSVEILTELPALERIRLESPNLGSPNTVGQTTWPGMNEGSGIFERTGMAKFKEKTNAEIAKRGFW